MEEKYSRDLKNQESKTSAIIEKAYDIYLKAFSKSDTTFIGISSWRQVVA